MKLKRFKFFKKVQLVLGVMLGMMLTASFAFAADPSVPIVNGAIDGGHATGCQHNHSSGCYSYGSHINSCYGSHANGFMKSAAYTCSKCGGSARKSYLDCTNCGALGTSFWMCSDTECGGKGSISNGFSGVCYSNLTCTSSHSTLNCSKGTYYNCIKPSLTSVGGSSDWVKEAYTPVLNGSNISQVQIGSGAWTAPVACKIMESGTYPIRVKSSSGHVMEYSLTVNNVDLIAPEAPSYRLLDLIKAKLGK